MRGQGFLEDITVSVPTRRPRRTKYARAAQARTTASTLNSRIVACDTPSRLIAAMGVRPVLKATVELPLEQVAGLPGVHNAHYLGQHLELETTQPQLTMAALHELAARLGRTIGDVMLRQPNLEDVFLKLTGRVLAEAGG